MKTFSTEPALSYIETILNLFIESSKMGSGLPLGRRTPYITP